MTDADNTIMTTMKTKTIKIYTFSELSPAAKDRAKYDARSFLGYSFADDALASLNALAGHFGARLKDYSIDWFNSTYSSAEFDTPDMEPEEIERRLKKLGEFNPKTGKGLGDCKLTGYCADEDAIDGFRLAWRQGERDLNKLLQEAFTSWLSAAQDDADGQYTDEAFGEFCDANGLEFTEDGRPA